jgi:hypothetical protein
MGMDYLLQILQQQAPYLLPFIAGVDYLKPEDNSGFPVPLVILKVRDYYLVVPIINDKILAIYVPQLDKFYPATPEWFQFALSKLVAQFSATSQLPGALEDYDLYEMVRPPLSGMTVWASAVDVVDEPISPEYYEYGLVVVVKKNVPPPAKAIPIPVDEPYTLEKIKPGKPYYLLSRDGRVVLGRWYRVYGDSGEGDAFLTEIGSYFRLYNVKNSNLPVGIPADGADFPLTANPKVDSYLIELNPETVMYNTRGDFELGTALFTPATELVVSPYVQKPIFAENEKVVLPENVNARPIVCPLPVDDGFDALVRVMADFVTEPETFAKQFAQHCIINLGADEYYLDGKRLDKKAAAQELVNMGLGPQDVYNLLQQNEAHFAVVELQSGLERGKKSPRERLEELLDAFDSQMRHLLRNYLDGNLSPEATQIVENLYSALANYRG